MHTVELSDIVSFEGFSFADYWNGEQNILKPQLEALGYTDIRFSTAEGDSFGPLIRVCRCIDPEGNPRKYFYG